MRLKAILKSNKHMYSIIKAVRKFQFDFLPYAKSRCSFNTKRMLRTSGIYRKSPYEKLKTIKGRHNGERCFIVATGPSLKIEDLNKLNGETTISMNSICLAFNETDWRPTYYGIQDEGVYGLMKKYIDELDVECKFISDNVLRGHNFEILKNHYIFPLNMLHHLRPNNTDYTTKFSKDIFATVYSGLTITYSLLQIAIYMGFKEIYLLGADCHYGGNMKHHFKDYDYVDPTFALAQDMMTTSYKVAKKYADKHNIKIYNATRGGMLEVFERVDLDEVLEKTERKSIAL
ncbi:DUF115 domain-containing protein [Bacillus sp. FJAT-49711]|nr:DUF115 domain-containing protein [Bacillus sp. FJAT-49711]